MHTLSNTTTARLPQANKEALGMDFACSAATNLPVGTLVKLGSDGLVTACAGAAVGEMPIGVVTVSNIRDTALVSVALMGVAIVKATSGTGGVTVGDKVKALSFAGGNTNFAVATTGYACGIALTTAAAAAEAKVLIFYSPVFIA